jgi:hypothetical protein
LLSTVKKNDFVEAGHARDITATITMESAGMARSYKASFTPASNIAGI